MLGSNDLKVFQGKYRNAHTTGQQGMRGVKDGNMFSSVVVALKVQKTLTKMII